MEKEFKKEQIVKEKNRKIASGKNTSSCTMRCCTCPKNKMRQYFDILNGYNAEVATVLNCFHPIIFAKIKEGDTVIDLGCGDGRDCFIASAITGKKGRIIGIDNSPKMIETARDNAKILRLTNVEFIKGNIEHIPLEANIADVVLSKCVINTVLNKQAVFKEINRILKPNGHFSIEDGVILKHLPKKNQSATLMYYDCVPGAIGKELYLEYIKEAGFKNITIKYERDDVFPDEKRNKKLPNGEIITIRKKPSRIIQGITVYAKKRGCRS